MKETNAPTTLPISELIVNGVYFDVNNNLIQIKKIDKNNKQIHFFNISEQTNYYFIKFSRCNLVKRIR